MFELIQIEKRFWPINKKRFPSYKNQSTNQNPLTGFYMMGNTGR